MTKLSPYLVFNGNCREAMTFYHECFGGALEVMKVGDAPIANERPPETHSLIMHADLKNDDFVLMGSDSMWDGEVSGGGAITILMETDDESKLRRYFAALEKDGEVSVPLELQFWGELYGQLKDKYGFIWQFNGSKSE